MANNIDIIQLTKYDGTPFYPLVDVNSVAGLSTRLNTIGNNITSLQNGLTTLRGYFDANGKVNFANLPNLYIGNAQVQSSAQTAQGIGGLGTLLPGATGTYDLGSSSLKWRGAYFGGTVNVGDELYVAADSYLHYAEINGGLDVVGIVHIGGEYDLLTPYVTSTVNTDNWISLDENDRIGFTLGDIVAYFTNSGLHFPSSYIYFGPNEDEGIFFENDESRLYFSGGCPINFNDSIIEDGYWEGYTIGVNFGGTGKPSWTQNGVVYASASNALAQVANVTGNSQKKFLVQTTNASGTAQAPAWGGIDQRDVLGTSDIGSTSLPVYYKGASNYALAPITDLDLLSQATNHGYVKAKRFYLSSDIYFEWIAPTSTTDGYVKLNAPLLTTGDQIVGSGTPRQGGGGGSTPYLTDLLDVIQGIQPAANKMLIWTSQGTNNAGTTGGWTLIDKSSVGVSTDATQSAHGLMSTADKIKLDSIKFGTQASDYIPITIGSTTKNVLTAHQSLAAYATQTWVNQQIDALPEPMVFKGSLGTGGTVTSLPAASSSNEGHTYKVITAGTYQNITAKVGDTFISTGSEWVLIPSGDEPMGTVTSVGLTLPTGLSFASDSSASPITSAGTFKIAFTSGYSIPTTANQTAWSNKYDKPSTGIPATDLASTVQTNITNGATAYGYFSSGILPVSHGGTGKDTLTSGNALIGNGTSAVTLRAITNNTVATAVTANTNLITANTLYYHTGNANISTVGTITSGTWHGNTIDNDYITNHTITVGSTVFNLGDTKTSLAGLVNVTMTGTLKVGDAEITWDGTNGYLKINKPLLTTGDQIVGSGTPGGSGSGSTPYLHELQDVTITNIDTGNLLQWNGSVWVNVAANTVGVTTLASASAPGLMSAADYSKLYNIEANANNYSLPLAANGTRGGIQIGYSSSGKNYAVQLSSEKAYVNVPWTDTTYKLTLNGTVKGTTGGTDLGSFYAPTSGGTANQVLIAGGNNTAPSWTNQSNLSVGTASKLGSATVGSASKPIYLNSGIATVVSTIDGTLLEGYISGASDRSSYIVSHPEYGGTSGVVIPFIYNDLAFLMEQGGHINIYSTTDTDLTKNELTVSTLWGSDADCKPIFDASPNYKSFSNSDAPAMNTGIVIDITLPSVFGASNKFYIDFGHRFGYGNIDIYVKHATYQTDYTNKVSGGEIHDTSQYVTAISHSFNDGTKNRSGFNRIRLFLYNRTRAGVGVRIAQIGLINYSSTGTRRTTMSRGYDDGVYRSISPASNSTYDLGQSTKRWSTIYGINANFSGTGTISGNTTVGGTLTVGTSSANKATTLNGTLGVTGATTLSSTLAVAGLATLSGGATIPSGKTLKIGDATIEWIPNSGNGYLKIDKPLLTTGDQIVGSGTPSSGGGGGSTPYLTDLQDVISGIDPSVDKMLIWTPNGTNNAGTTGGWTLIDKSSVGVTTVASASANGLMSSSDWSKLNGIEAGANNYVHPTGGANVTISAANGKVLSAITVNNLGHVTSVSSKTLAAADIPSITKGKISDFPTTWALANITGADDLKAIEALTGTSGFLKKTAANTWTLDTNTYLTSHQTVTLASGTNNGTLKITTAAGTTDNIAVKGLQALAYKASIAFSDLSAHPTTISGYGITDAYTKIEVNTAISNAVTAALYFRGESSTEITNGGTETATINGSPWTAHTGDVVLYNGLEFAWDGTKWIQFGDESSYVLKTTTVNGHPLSGNVTVTKGDVGLGNVDNLAASGYLTAFSSSSSTPLSITVGGTTKSLSTLYATRLTTVSKTAWGQTFWTSGGVPDTISGNMSSVGKMTFTAQTTKSTSGNVLEVVTIDGVTYLHTTLPFLSDGDQIVGSGSASGGGGGGASYLSDLLDLSSTITGKPAGNGYGLVYSTSASDKSENSGAWIYVAPGTTANISGANTTARLWSGSVIKSAIEAYGYVTTDNKVTQTATTTSSAYELLFSATADNTTRTEGARKTSTLTYNPSTKALLTGGTVDGLTLAPQATGFKISGGTTSRTLTVGANYTLGAACAKAVDSSISAASTSANLPTSAAVASFVEGKGYITSYTNTWRGVYTGGTSRVGTGTGTKAINFVAGSNVTVSYEAAGTGSGQSGSADYFNVKIAATDTKYTNGTGISLSGTTFSLNVAGAKTALGLGTMAYETASNYLTTTTAASTYVKFSPGTSEQTISSSISSFVKGVINLWRSSGDHYAFLGFSNGTTETYLGGIGFKSQSDHNLYHKDGSNYYTIFDENNYTSYVNATNFPGLNKTGTVTKVSTGTGLTGGDITTTGTISISSTYQSYITHGESAYNSLGNYVLKAGDSMSGGLAICLTPSSSYPVDRIKATLIVEDDNEAATGEIRGGNIIISRGYSATANSSAGAITFYGRRLSSSYRNGARIASEPTPSYTSYDRQDLVFYRSNNSNDSVPTWEESMRISSQGLAYIKGLFTYSLYVDNNASGATSAGIRFRTEGTAVGGIFVNSSNDLYFSSGTSSAGSKVLTASNYDSYALPLSAGNSYPLTGHLYLNEGLGIQAVGDIGLLVYHPTSGWTGINSTQWGLGSINSQGVIRSNNNDLLHYKGSSSYSIWDASNSGISTKPWACSTLSVNTSLTLPNDVSILGTLTDSTTASMIKMSTSNNIVVGSSSFAHNVNLYGTLVKFYAGGTTAIGTVSSTGLEVTGTVTASGIGTFDRVVLSNTGAVSHIEFTRAGWNYISTPTDGVIAFNTGGSGSANTSMAVTPDGIRAGTKGVHSCGLPTAYWGSIYGKDLYLGGDAYNTAAGSIIFSEKLDDQRNGFKIAPVHATSANRVNLVFYRSNNGNSPWAANWTTFMTLSYDGKATIAGSLTTSGDQTISSDATLKTNWKELNYTVKDIANVKIGVFDWKDGHGTSAGSIAQDWKKLIPELVHGDEGNMTLAYGQVALLNTVLLARHENEQDKEIKELKNRIVALENEINQLRNGIQ